MLLVVLWLWQEDAADAFSLSSSSSSSSSKRALFVLTNHEHVQIPASSSSATPSSVLPTGWYLPECSHPYFTFTKAGYEVQFASIAGGYCPVTPASTQHLEQDAENQAFWTNDHLRKLTTTTKAISACDPKDYAAVFFVGGFGTMWDFPFSQSLAEFTQSLHDDHRGLIGAVCHGPIALLNVKTSSGKYLIEEQAVTAFCNEEEQLASSFMVPYFPSHDLDDRLRGKKTCEELLSARGAKYFKQSVWSAHVQQSGRIFTGQNPASARPLSLKMIEALQQRSN